MIIERLSKEDSERIIESLLNPPEPSEALIKAFQKYKKIMEGKGDATD